jgi:calcineurin-like phosphoesterase family protein
MIDPFDPVHGMRLYIIGDIHGRSDLLDQMVAKIREDIAGHGEIDCLTVTLGDYVDRGRDSRGVLERLSRNPFPTRYMALKGNHEALLEMFLKNPAIGEQWCQLGGLETLHSYGVSIQQVMWGRGFEDAAHTLRAAIPEHHYRFLSALRPFVSVDRYYLCHAGVRPGIPLAQQRIEDLLWIRDEFLNSEANFEKLIIHGHTPNEMPEVRPNRINLDTGAFATGRLTCLVIEGDQSRFIFTA